MINSYLQKVTDWFKVNKLSIDVGKTNFMIMGTPEKQTNKQKSLNSRNIYVFNFMTNCMVRHFVDHQLTKNKTKLPSKDVRSAGSERSYPLSSNA